MNGDLFSESSDLKRCDGCGRMFDASELKRCRICGEYFCPECRKMHDCRTQTYETKTADSVGTEKAIENDKKHPPVNESYSQSIESILQQEEISQRRDYISQSIESRPQTSAESECQNREIPQPVLEQGTVTESIAPDKKRCDGCGRIFDAAKLKQCKNCGEYFCLECRKTHDCRITPNRERRTKIILSEESQIRPRSNSVPRQSEKPVVTISAELNEKPNAESSHMVVSGPGTNEMPDVPMPVAPSAEPMHKFVPKPRTDEELRYSSEILCDDCGKYYDITQMKRCIKCDALLCPRCRKTHSCRKQGPAEHSSVSKHGEQDMPEKQNTSRVTKTAYNLLDDMDLPPTSLENRRDEQTTSSGKEKNAPNNQFQLGISLDLPEISDLVPPATGRRPEEKRHPDDEMRCERCGQLYKKTDLRRCHKCGVILCPDCRKHHRCSKKWI